LVVAERSVGVQRDFGAEQVGGGALELEHVEQVAVAGDVAAEPAGRGECQVRDAVPGGEPDQLGSVAAHLLFCRGWQVRRLGEWLAHFASVSAAARPGRRR
jgi:hypothetical protein